jgi:capsular polysaccharide biosynthesis protein
MGVAFLVLCLISGALLALQPRMYLSEAIVEFSVDSTNSTAMTETWRSRILTEMEVINSPDLQRQVIEELKLDAVLGKRYNNGKKLSLSDTLATLKVRTDTFVRQGSRQIGIRIYGEDPVETPEIANSLAWNYCNRFTKPRGISARISMPARSPAEVKHLPLIFEIPKAIIRSFILALLAACVGWGIAITRAKMLRMPPPVPAAENAARRFQKY